MTKVKSRWVTKGKFRKLKVGQNVIIRYMIGDAEIVGEPTQKLTTHMAGNPLKQDCVDVHFNSGPWKGRTLTLNRQQISTGNKSFPDRKEY